MDRPETLERARSLGHLGPDYIEANYEGRRTLLHLAASRGFVRVVEVLLDSGAAISAIDRWRQTPLHLACKNGHVAMAKLLVERGANINAKTRDRYSSVFIAINSNNNLELVDFLLRKGCNPTGRAKGGLTPLHRAAMYNLLEMSKLLLSHGSDMTAKTELGLTALDCAGTTGGARLVTVLLEAVDRMSALHRAARFTRPDALKLLIDDGYDVNMKSLDCGYTPLYEALRRGHLDAMRVLLDEGADVNAELDNGTTMLHAAAAAKEVSVDMVRLLVEKGANTAARDGRGRSPLDVAVAAGNYGVEELLSGNSHVGLHLNSE